MEVFSGLLLLIGNNPEAMKQVATGVLRLLGLLGPEENLTPEQIASLEAAATEAKGKLDAAAAAALPPAPSAMELPPF